MYLQKRGEEYFAPKPVIVLLCILGAMLAWVMGYAIHRTFGFGEDPNQFKHITVEQMEYMAEVRVRNMDMLAYEGQKSQLDSRRGKEPSR
jgi:hypothetical protein